MARYANVVCDCAAENFMFAPDGNAMSIQLTMRMVVPYNICDGATRAECGMKRKFPETLTSQYKICGSGELKKKQISMVYGEWCTTLEWKTFIADFAPLDQEGEQIPA